MRQNNQIAVVGAKLRHAARQVIIGRYQPDGADFVFSDPGGGFNGVFHRVGGIFFKRYFPIGRNVNVFPFFQSIKRCSLGHAGNQQLPRQPVVQQAHGFADSVAAAGQHHDGVGFDRFVRPQTVDAIAEAHQPAQPAAKSEHPGINQYFFSHHIIFSKVLLTV